MHQNSKQTFTHRTLVGTGMMIMFVVIASLAVHFAWNMAMPDLFGAAKMTFRNAVGLTILLGIAALSIGQMVNRHGQFGLHRLADTDQD